MRKGLRNLLAVATVACMSVTAIAALAGCNSDEEESIWENGICRHCGEEHSHTYDAEGNCTVCDFECAHTEHDKFYLTCNKCGIMFNHEFEGGNCTMCDADDSYIYGSVDSLYVKDCAEKGTVEQLTYECTALAGQSEGQTITKKVNVYLPYGYDASNAYDVLYYLHGAGGTVNDLIRTDTVTDTQKLLDNMIKEKVCEPFIFVCPTWVDSAEGTYDMSGVLQENFNIQLRDSIIPVVESTYSTWLDCDGDIANVTPEKIAESRDHRAVAGFSGGATVSGMMIAHGLDMFSYFGMNSNAYNADLILAGINSAQFKDYEINYIFNSLGTEEANENGPQNISNIENYLKLVNANNARLVDGENMNFIRLWGLPHDAENLRAALFNMLKNNFFKAVGDETDYSAAKYFTGTLTGSVEVPMYNSTKEYTITLHEDMTITMEGSAYDGFLFMTDVGTYVINSDGTITATFTLYETTPIVSSNPHNDVCIIKRVRNKWTMHYTVTTARGVQEEGDVSGELTAHF